LTTVHIDKNGRKVCIEMCSRRLKAASVESVPGGRTSMMAEARRSHMLSRWCGRCTRFRSAVERNRDVSDWRVGRSEVLRCSTVQASWTVTTSLNITRSRTKSQRIFSWSRRQHPSSLF